MGPVLLLLFFMGGGGGGVGHKPNIFWFNKKSQPGRGQSLSRAPEIVYSSVSIFG